MTVWNIVASGSIGGIFSVIVALISYRMMAPRTRQEAQKFAAETRETDVDTQGKLLTQVRELIAQVSDQGNKISRLEQTIAEQGEQIAALQRRNHDLAATMRAALVELLTWIRRALDVMTPDQQSNVGQPPDYQHLITAPERG